MSEEALELYRVHRDIIQRYTYFLLAAAGAAIGFALSQTKGTSLSWSQIPLGAAILFWGVSFFLGCRHIVFGAHAVSLNSDLIRVVEGRHEISGRSPVSIQVGREYLKELIDKNAQKSGRFFRWQFILLVAGAVSYILWHVTEMAIRTSAT